MNGSCRVDGSPLVPFDLSIPTIRLPVPFYLVNMAFNSQLILTPSNLPSSTTRRFYVTSC